MSLQPLKLYGGNGPNPAKVRMILDELNLNYEIVEVSLKDTKTPEFVKINPNGRIPALEDPNTGITLWESGAIIEYVVDKYDVNKTLSFPAGSDEYWLAKQYLFFQMSGQGPYFEQAIWFTKQHHEELPSAKAHFYNQISRVCGVFEDILTRSEAKYGSGGDGPWLVGNKCSYADISFVMWQKLVESYLGEAVGYHDQAYPKVHAWVQRMVAREKTGARLKAAVEEMQIGQY